MQGVEVFPDKPLEQPQDITADQLMGVFQQNMLARNAFESTRRSIRGIEQQQTETFSDRRDGGMTTLPEEAYLQRLGQLSESALQKRASLGELVLAQARAKTKVFEAVEANKARPVRVTSLMPDYPLQPIRLLKRQRGSHGVWTKFLDYATEVSGTIKGIDLDVIDSPKLELKPRSPKHVGLTRVYLCRVRMVNDDGEPLVNVEFLD